LGHYVSSRGGLLTFVLTRVKQSASTNFGRCTPGCLPLSGLKIHTPLGLLGFFTDTTAGPFFGIYSESLALPQILT
jgi:hypothetical protein